MLSPSVTKKDPASPGVYWRHQENSSPLFNPIVFDEIRLIQQGLISGQAVAGRGNTFFLNLDGQPLVLRHYRRGGLVRKVSAKRYFYTGLAQTRAMLEFDILQQMHDRQLPVPKPYACRVAKHGIVYEASIVTHRLEGKTLAQQLLVSALADEVWIKIGQTLARFHAEGIYHADLNAHNILVSNEGVVSLIDFDRARYRAFNACPSNEQWCLASMNRLQRSIKKVVLQTQGNVAKELTDHAPSTPVANRAELFSQNVMRGYALLKSSWNSALVEIVH